MNFCLFPPLPQFHHFFIFYFFEVLDRVITPDLQKCSRSEVVIDECLLRSIKS